MMSFMGILIWIIVGMISAWFVHAFMKRPDSKVLADQLLGAVGAIAGGLTATGILHIPDSIDGLNPVAILAACAGAVVLVSFVAGALSNRRIAG
jgi:uncharacterized membrane protein YeaQ/YmgE (transglycosylase-associated protein family)